MVGRALLRGTGKEPRAAAARGPAAPRGAVADATESAVPRLVGAIAIALPSGLLIQALVDHATYRHPVVPVVVWLSMLAAAAWLMPRARAGDLSTAHAGLAVLAAAAAVIAIGLDHKVTGTAGTTMDWTILGTLWLLALIALSCPARLWVPGAALVIGIQGVFVLRALGASPLGLTRLAVSAYVVVSILAIFSALRPALRTRAEIALRRAALTSRSAAEHAAAAAISEVRHGRLELLEMEALPLLRGIAGGNLDPADSEVRGQCAQLAATLRLALADRTLTAGTGLLADLEPVLSVARSRNVPVEIQVIGDPGRPGEDVVRAIQAAAGDILQVLPAQPVILTVLASGEQAELFLTFERAPGAGCDVPRLRQDVAGLGSAVRANAAWRAMLEVEDTGQGCLEVSWRKAVPV